MFTGEGNWRQQVWEDRRNDGPAFNNLFNPMDLAVDPLWSIRTGLEMIEERDRSEAADVDRKLARVITATTTNSNEPHIGWTPYTVFFEKLGPTMNLIGLNCYMPDYRVPGQPAETKHRQMLDELFAELGV